MKALSVWTIIDRLQRQLERERMSPAIADRVIVLAVRQLAAAGSVGR